MSVNPGDLHRYNLLVRLVRLNRINSLTEKLHTQLTQADDWLLGFDHWDSKESLSCLRTASRCAAEARKTLDIIEKEIRKTEVVTDRMKN